MSNEEKELNALREKIDALDYKIHDLINARAKLAMQVSAVKIKYNGPNVEFHRPEREKIIIEKVKTHNSGPLDENSIARIFESILTECRNLQINSYMKSKK